MVFFDTETYPRWESPTGTRQDFHLGVAHYWRKRRDGKPDNHEWLRFTDIPKFWGWTLKKATSHSILYLVAHNLAFDAQVCQMFVELPERGWRLIFLFENGDTRLIRWGMPTTALVSWLADGQHISDFEGKRWAKTLLAMDDCNLFAGSIERWGKALNFPKLHRPAYDAPDEEWWPYCQRDVEVMVKLWQEWFAFLDAENLGTFRTTIGSQAFAGFRHAYMHNRIEIHDNEAAIALERDSYRGGRSEAFWVGRREDGPFYKLDVNSMYPTVMYENHYPSHLLTVGDRLSLKSARTLLDGWGMIARVSLDVDVPVFPVQVKGKNVYPVGQFSTVLCTPEIRVALDNGWIKEIGEFATYRMRRVFYWYVDHFYKLKVQYDQSGDTLHRSLVKLLLNSLYGKFGQMGYEDRIIGTCDPDDIQVEYGMRFPSRQRFTIYHAGGSVIESARTGEGFNSFVAVASHVTAYARLYLWGLIEQAGRDHVFYSDTDSLIVDRQGYDNLAGYLDPERLGYLKIEETANTLEIRAPKDYTLGTHTVRKGVPLKASILDRNAFAMETWPSLKTHLAEGQTDTFHNVDVIKHLSYSVDWGDIQPDGWVSPYFYGTSPLIL